MNLCAISFNRNKELHSLDNSKKIENTEKIIKLCPQKLYQCHILKQVNYLRNFVRFQGKESEIGLSQEFREK